MNNWKPKSKTILIKSRVSARVKIKYEYLQRNSKKLPHPRPSSNPISKKAFSNFKNYRISSNPPSQPTKNSSEPMKHAFLKPPLTFNPCNPSSKTLKTWLNLSNRTIKRHSWPHMSSGFRARSLLTWVISRNLTVRLRNTPGKNRTR